MSRVLPLLDRLRGSASRPSTWARWAQLNLGLLLMGLGLALMLQANVGLGPWAVFHEGLAHVTGLSFGRVLQIVGVIVLVVSWRWTGERPGPGTVLNMAIVGPWVDLFAAQPWLPASTGWGWGMAEFAAGAMVIGVASGLYITADLGAGPRDGFVLGLSRRLSLSVRRTRSLLELGVLAVGFALGGAVGLGTVLFALSIGPMMQFSIRVFRPFRVTPAASR